jgi:hypothetical protein
MRSARNAEDREHAVTATKAFEAYVAECPKAVAKIVYDIDNRRALLDFPADQRRSPNGRGFRSFERHQLVHRPCIICLGLHIRHAGGVARQDGYRWQSG